MKKSLLGLFLILSSLSVQAASLELSLDSKQSLFKAVTLSKNAWAKLPLQFNLKQKTTSMLTLIMKVNAHSESDFEFYCTYRAYETEKFIKFNKCKNKEGSVIVSSADDLRTIDFPLDKGSQLTLDLLKSDHQRVIIKTKMSVDWK